MPVTFESPWFLALVLLAVPLGVAGVSWFKTMSRARAWSAVVLRAVLIALLASILAGAASVRRSDRLAVIAVVDVSDSMRMLASEFGGVGEGGGGWSGAMRAWLERAAAERGADDLLGVVAFDGSAVAVATPTRGEVEGLSLDYRVAQGTDIAGALRFAEALFPPDAARRLVLASDGNETAGDAVEAARELAGRGGLPIDVLPVAYRVEREVMVERVDVPPQAGRGSTVTVRVVLSSTHEATGRLDLLYEGEQVDLNGAGEGRGRRVTLREGRNVVSVDVELRDTVVHRFEPVFTPDEARDDRIASNNRAETFTVTPGDGSVLIVDGTGQGSRSVLLATLRENGIRAEWMEPSALPSNLLALQAYDLIVLENVASEEIERGTHDLLADYVEKLGGGLVMVGGPDSFGAGGWNGTALEPVLPVLLDLPEEVITPSAAIAFVLDSSGSMAQTVLGGSRSQQQIANEAAALAIGTLDKTDLLMVISFQSSYRVVVPLERNAEPNVAAARVRSISPGGGTNLYPALEEAGRQLDGVEASVKHVIVLSDGQSQGEPAVGIGTAARMRERGITVSAIAVGDGADFTTLGELAKAGGGQFYAVYDPNVLPRIFVKEIRVVRRPLIREGSFEPVETGTGSALVSGLPLPSPSLGGLVLTRPRDDPKITYSLVTPTGEPLLADWFVGRGRVAAFTSDASRWASRWLREGWPGYAMLWTRIARQVSRPAAGRDYELLTEIDGDDLVIRLDAFDEGGSPLDMLSVEGTVYLPEGGEEEVRLGQVGPGAYEARVPATLRGNYVVALSPRLGDRPLSPVVGGTSRAVGPEFRSLGSNVGLLREVAEATGGRVLSLDDPSGAELFDRRDVRESRASRPLWPVLLAWSLVVFVLDVGTRRVAWDRLVTRELAQEIRSKAGEVARRRSEGAAATVSGLRAGAARTREARGGGEKAPAPGPAPLRARVPGSAGSAGSRSEAGAAGRDDEMERRRAALRRQMLDQLSGKGSKRVEAGDEGVRTETRGEEGETTSGLLAAKRRARARLEGEEGDATG